MLTETLAAELHPKWELEVQVESWMRDRGLDKVDEQRVEAQERRQMTRLEPMRRLMQDWVEPVAESWRDWRNAAARARGVKPLALEQAQGIDPRLGAFLAIGCVLDSVTAERMSVQGVASYIGRKLEHEMKLRAMIKANPKLMRTIQRRFDKDKATAAHRERANINQMSVLLEDRKVVIDWKPWTDEMVFRVGVSFVEAIIRATGWFELGDDPFFRNKSGKFRSPNLVLLPKPRFVEWLGASMHQLGLHRPQFTPTVIPPKQWDGTRSGGYHTKQVMTPRLIRFKASQIDQRESAADEYEALDMPLVYEALHFVQEVPWRVNERVLAVAEKLWEYANGKFAVAGLPQRSEIEFPKRAKEDLEGEELRAHKAAMAETYKRRVKQVSQVAGVSRTLKTAAEYVALGNCFYYPHMMDFRGRMYPIPVGLQPQGDDLARALLEFREGKRIGLDNSGDLWLASHLASVWGHDKEDFEFRVKWVRENEKLFRRIAADPVKLREAWVNTDKPFQVLAAVFEWVAFLDHGPGFVSHLPVSVDGTCNGIQHLSAMTRDKVAGAYVNLTPSTKPQDIYKYVARLLQAELDRISSGGGLAGQYADYWLSLTDHDIPRSLTKRQVMVLPYGGTMDSYLEYTREWLDEMDPLPQSAPREQHKERNHRIGFLAKHLWAVVTEAIPGAVKIMAWLKACATKAAVGNQPIFWTTPTGFVVRHFYGKQHARQVKINLTGQRMDLTITSTTKDLDKTAQARGIAPNFVHSLDADALRKCILLCKERGVTAFTAIHDAYGTHAADMDVLSECLREAFVWVHEHDLLADFRNMCAAVITGRLVEEGKDPMDAMQIADETLPPMLDMGDLDIKEVLESPYFFA